MSPLALVLVVLSGLILPFLASAAFVVASRTVGRVLARGERPDPHTQALLAAQPRPGLLSRSVWTLAEGWFQVRAGVAQLAWVIGLLPRSLGPADGPLVLVLPGYLENGGKMAWIGRKLADDGFRVHLLDFPSTTHALETNIDWLRQTVDGYLEQGARAELCIVAHSMGGVVARRMVTREGRGVRRVVCIASPHRGTHLARLSFHASARDMRPDLGELAHKRAPSAVPIDGVMSLSDNIVAPAWSFATHEGAMYILPEPAGHIAPLYMQRVRIFVSERLAAVG